MTTRRYTLSPSAVAQRRTAARAQGPGHGRHSVRVPGAVYKRLLALRSGRDPIWAVILRALDCMPECSRVSTAVRTSGDGAAGRTAD